MDDFRDFRSEDDDRTVEIDDEREYHVAPSEDEVPFHIPRD